ncbi:MAG: YybH family protein [Candidatus Acidiferrales bacterium]
MKRDVRGAGWLALLLCLSLAGSLAARDADEVKIEAVIESVIEAHRNGDVNSMGRYYASDVRFVPADFNPPIQGWAAVAERYRQAFSQLSGVELVRENTRIERRGKIAWAVYQWRFAGVAGNQTMGALGHTTLILEMRGRDWIIDINHTSALPAPPETAPPTPASERP